MAHIVGGELPQLDVTDERDHGLEDVAVGLRPGRKAHYRLPGDWMLAVFRDGAPRGYPYRDILGGFLIGPSMSGLRAESAIWPHD